MRTTATLTTLLALVACNPEQTPDVEPEAPFGRVAGFVTDIDGNGLASVEVDVQDMVVLTDDNGRFTVDGVLPESDLVVEFTREGYAKSYATASVLSWETASANATLLEVDGYDTFDAALGGTVQVERVSVDFAPGAVIDADGNSYSGIVTAAVTHVDPYTQELEGAPGDLQALMFDVSGTSKDAMTAAQLISYGMVDVTLTGEDGEELNVDEDAPAEVEMPITNPDALGDWTQLASGDAMDTWSFDKTRGRWVEEGEGETFQDEDGNLMFRFEASHFSWWNCDQGNPPSCATGRVIDFLGFPVRSAEVTCGGNMSTSVTTTDEDGYYVCNILVGDTVDFRGRTHVSQRNWSKTVPNVFLYGYGSSAADCQPIEDIEIDVCRVTGALNVENVESVTDDGVLTDADHVSANFWEPKGDIEYCTNPWDALGNNECAVIDPTNAASFFPSSAVPGFASDSRSVGSYLKVMNGRGRAHKMERSSDNGSDFYNIDILDEGNGRLQSDRPDFQGGDALDVYAPGDAGDYMGAWDESRIGFVPRQLTWQTAETLRHNGGNVALKYTGANNAENGALVLGTNTQGDEALMCRFDDDGRINLPDSAVSQLTRGWAGLGVYHLEDSYTLGPDGMPIQLQLFSGATTSIELN